VVAARGGYARIEEAIRIIDGSDGIEAAGTRIFEKILAVASGGHTLGEDDNYGDNEFVPWQIGAVTQGEGME